MYTVYNLRNDPHLKVMQDLSQSESVIGTQPTPAVIGSEKWWRHVESGSLAIHRAEGLISGFWPGQYEQGPAEFRLQEDNGSTSNWSCGIDPAEATRLFLVGRRCAVEFVELELKMAFQGRSHALIAIRIAVADGDESYAA